MLKDEALARWRGERHPEQRANMNKAGKRFGGGKISCSGYSRRKCEGEEAGEVDKARHIEWGFSGAGALSGGSRKPMRATEGF